MGAIIKGIGKGKGISKASKVPVGSFTAWPSEIIRTTSKAIPKPKKLKITKKEAFIAGAGTGAAGSQLHKTKTKKDKK